MLLGQRVMAELLSNVWNIRFRHVVALDAFKMITGTKPPLLELVLKAALLNRVLSKLQQM